LTILGLPCNQFGGQEPGDNDIIYNRARGLGTSFPIFGRVDANGPDTHPVFHYLKNYLGGWFMSNDLKWNFHKFVVNSEGVPIERTLPTTQPNTLEPLIQTLLKDVHMDTLPEHPPFGMEEPTQILTKEDVAELKIEWSENKKKAQAEEEKEQGGKKKKETGTCSAEF
jgi:hypothetical protein